MVYRKKVLIVNWGTATAVYVLRQLIFLENYEVYLAASASTPESIKRLFKGGRFIKTNPYNSIELIGDVSRYCVEKSIRFDIVTTFFEMSVFETALLADYLGVQTFLTPGAALKTSVNKDLMRKVLANSGVSQPKFMLFNENTLNLAYLFLHNCNKAAVIKPVHSGHSYGVRYVDKNINLITFKNVFAEAESDFEADYDEWMEYEHGSRMYLIEDYIEGKIFSFDGVVSDDARITFVGQTEFEISSPPILHQIAHTSPVCSLKDKQKINGKKTVDKIIKTLGMRNCGFHCELKFVGDVAYLIEIAGRLPGAVVLNMYQNLSENNIFDTYLNILSKSKNKVMRNNKVFKSETLKIIRTPINCAIVKNIPKITKIRELDYEGNIKSRNHKSKFICEKKSSVGTWLYEVNLKSKVLDSGKLRKIRDIIIDKNKVTVYSNLFIRFYIFIYSKLIYLKRNLMRNYV